MVGGGIRSAETAGTLAQAGADALVVGTLTESIDGAEQLAEIARAIT